ncbi:unnamed protein product [Rhodiola kirilowii]
MAGVQGAATTCYTPLPLQTKGSQRQVLLLIEIYLAKNPLDSTSNMFK